MRQYSCALMSEVDPDDLLKPEYFDVSGFKIDVDGDSVADGRIIVCPAHPQKPLFVFGTGWWEANGGTFENNPSWEVWCGMCQRYYQFSAWSYRG